MKETNSFPMCLWYPKLSHASFPAVFLALTGEELEAMKNRQTDTPVVKNLLSRLAHCMNSFPGNRFVSVDCVSPTDTERFQSKRGAVHSAESAWKNLLESRKVAESLERGEVTSLCIRPFRNMQMAREFRLFIKDGILAGMSQYYLVRHFRRLPGRVEQYFLQAQQFVEQIRGLLPAETLCMDIYFKSSGGILIVDLNPWGESTDPLMYNTWDRNWEEQRACLIVPPPHCVRGDIKVRF